MAVNTKKKLAKYLLITQIGIYCFIIIHSILWHVFGIHILTKLCPFAFREQIGNLEFNINIIFWFLIFCSTLFLGRVFCAWGCMFGAYQDFVSHLTKKLKIKPLNNKAEKWVARILVSIILILYIIGNTMYWPTLFWFSIAIITSGLIIWLLVEKEKKYLNFPKYIFFSWYLGGIIASWITLNVFKKGITFVFDKYKILDSSLIIWTFLAIIAVSVAIGILTGTKRIFCRFLCPVGVLLRFLSANPFPYKFKVRLTNNKCVKCSKCDKACFMDLKPMDEINKYGTVKNPNCINCLVCVSSCPKNALDFITNKKTISEE